MRNRLIGLIIVFILVQCATSAMSLKQTVDLGSLPSKIVLVENRTGTYYAALLKGDSSIVVLDEDFRVLRKIDGLQRDGVEDIMFHEGQLFLMGFRSGNLLIMDAYDSPWAWTISSTVRTGSRLVTGTPINGMIALLSFDEELIIVDLASERIVYREQLPVQALSIAADDNHIYVPLYYNFDLLSNSYVTQEGLLLFNTYGRIVNSVENVGRRPSYVFLHDDYICVISYLDGTLTIISRRTSEHARTFNVGRYPGKPVVHDGIIWIPATGSHRLARVDLSNDRVDYFYTAGRGPSRILLTDDYLYVIHAVSGKIEKMDHRGMTLSVFELNGYPVDLLHSNGMIAVVVEQSWDPACRDGWLTVLGDS